LPQKRFLQILIFIGLSIGGLVGCSSEEKLKVQSEVPIDGKEQTDSKDSEKKSETPQAGDTTIDPETEFPKFFSPLTGLALIDEGATKKAITAVKIDNSDSLTQPMGIRNADIVYEYLGEEKATNFLALFQSGNAENVGPVGEAQLSDIHTLMNQPSVMLATAQTKWEVREVLKVSGIHDVSAESFPASYTAVNDDSGREKIYVSLNEIRDLDPENRLNPLAPWKFTDKPDVTSAEKKQVDKVSIDWGETKTVFKWMPTEKHWARFNEDTPSLDAEGIAIYTQNLVVQFVRYSLSNELDRQGERIPVFEADVGIGEAWIFNGSSRLEAAWSKDNLTAPTVFSDERGNIVKFSQGSSWVLLAKSGSATILEK
jgi:hypothetical protein|tara:strand:- start:799 stop:1911 length:1113 start_codon:yes stop_codon:yes gene_type:complete